MDLKQREYFVRVAELGGFSKAAAVLVPKSDRQRVARRILFSILKR